MSSTATFIIVTIFIAMASTTISAQMDMMSPSSGPTAAPDCLTNLLNMSDCLSYVQEGGSAKPDKACCPELAGLVDSAPQCLCYLLGGNMAEQYGIKIDMPKALKLPQVCRVETPPPSLCSLFGVPVGAPVGTGNEETSPASSPTTSVGESPGGGIAAGPVNGRKNNAPTKTLFLNLYLLSFAFAIHLYL